LHQQNTIIVFGEEHHYKVSHIKVYASPLQTVERHSLCLLVSPVFFSSDMSHRKFHVVDSAPSTSNRVCSFETTFWKQWNSAFHFQGWVQS